LRASSPGNNGRNGINYIVSYCQMMALLTYLDCNLPFNDINGIFTSVANNTGKNGTIQKEILP
jgi:hypothetical protein